MVKTSVPKMKEEEIKIRRLMQKCEDWLSNKISNVTDDKKWWRLDQYIATLDGRIKQLEESDSIDNDVLTSFKQNLQVLKQVVHKAKDDLAKSQQQLSSLGNRPALLQQQQQYQHSVGNTSKQLLHRVASKKEAELRNELFGRNAPSSSGGMSPTDSGRQSLRYRRVLSTEDLDAVLETHQQMQDKLAEDMIAMAKSLKNNSLIAQDIIRGDTKTLTKTTELAEKNIENLGTETKRLKKHSVNACSCGIWIMLLFVFIVFFFMILFIRIAPK